MAEVLSQQEIDQLLNKVKSGEEQSPSQPAEKEAILFDFRLPNRISKNQLRTIRNINETFAEGFAGFLVSKLQSIVNITVTSIDQIYYSEYILSVSNPACLYTFEIRNTDIKGILELNIDFSFALVDRLLGGNGEGSKQNNVITVIEQKVIGVIAERIMQDLKKAWQMVDNFDFKVEKFESDIDFAQITSQNESVLLISFEIMIGEKSYMMNLCFATFAFDVILSKLSLQKMTALRPTRYAGTTSNEILTNHLYKTNLPITVEFGVSKLSVQDIMELQKDDVFKLETLISDEQKVKVGNKTLFYGRTGIVNGHKAIKVTRKIEKNNNTE
ncbi:MAG TPA: flagellar motor switch protein FliM [Ignavibacteria bacterium]|nr:flagellar motor switch protein FliM [Ignavibacteria bacterium]